MHIESEWADVTRYGMRRDLLPRARLQSGHLCVDTVEIETVARLSSRHATDTDTNSVGQAYSSTHGVSVCRLRVPFERDVCVCVCVCVCAEVGARGVDRVYTMWCICPVVHV